MVYLGAGIYHMTIGKASFGAQSFVKPNLIIARLHGIFFTCRTQRTTNKKKTIRQYTVNAIIMNKQNMMQCDENNIGGFDMPLSIRPINTQVGATSMSDRLNPRIKNFQNIYYFDCCVLCPMPCQQTFSYLLIIIPKTHPLNQRK